VELDGLPQEGDGVPNGALPCGGRAGVLGGQGQLQRAGTLRVGVHGGAQDGGVAVQ